MPSKRGRSKKRQHTYHRPKERPGRRVSGTHRCPECGKWCFRVRSDAEAYVRQMFPGAVCHYYRCNPDDDGSWWHFTSMNAVQVEGLKEARYAVASDIEYSEWDDEEPEETVALTCGQERRRTENSFPVRQVRHPVPDDRGSPGMPVPVGRRTVNGKHGGGECTVTWGTCDTRSNRDPRRKEVLPHVCGEGPAGHPGPHVCTACDTPQS
jgi:hypothetical protein